MASTCVAMPLDDLPYEPSSNSLNLTALNDFSEIKCFRLPTGFTVPNPYQACSGVWAKIGEGSPREPFIYSEHPERYVWEDEEKGCDISWTPTTGHKDAQTTRGDVASAAVFLRMTCFPGWDSEKPTYHGTITLDLVPGQSWWRSEVTYSLHARAPSNETEVPLIQANSS